PRLTPNSIATPTAPKPTPRDARAPHTVRERTSRPNSSVPSGNPSFAQGREEPVDERTAHRIRQAQPRSQDGCEHDEDEDDKRNKRYGFAEERPQERTLAFPLCGDAGSPVHW